MSKYDHLSDEEFADLCEYTNPAAQLQWLAREGYVYQVHYVIARSGRPKLFRYASGPKALGQLRSASADGTEGARLLLRLQEQAAQMDRPRVQPRRRQAKVGRA